MVTGGHWDFQELDHINCLELKAVFLGLKSLCRDRRDTHVRLKSDNTTVIACIDRNLFDKLCKKYFVTDLDLFATRINAQLDMFVSWKPDPDACHTNAFTISWSRELSYAFPPFSVIGKMLQKIQEDRATLLVILPLWPTQVWFPKALQLLVEDLSYYHGTASLFHRIHLANILELQR